MTDIRKKIEEIAVDDGGKWLKKARYRRANRGWLRKSQNIAIRVLSVLDEKGMQQKELAEAMDVSPQQVSKIVKGKQNLTLQTVSKLEQVLGISLFEIPRPSFTTKVESKKGITANFDKRKERSFKTQEPLKTVVNGSYNPEEQKKSPLSLVKA
jgi:transcriptional regulator with XRE-family HTH domain